jgi:NADH-quinone oxidoreductase subunit J
MTFNPVDIALVVALVLAALWTVMTVRTLRSAIGLAVTSAILAVIMFRLASPLAAVFELSVCAGLIPVIFISTIGLTHRVEEDDMAAKRREKLKKYAALLALVLVVAGVLVTLHLPNDFTAAQAAAPTDDPKIVMWELRHVDLIGQLGVLAAGAFGVLVLVKATKRA